MYSLWFCQMKHQEWTLNWMPDTVCVAAAPVICSLSNLAASLHANFLFLLCYLFTPLITALHSVSRLSSYFKYSRLLHRHPITKCLQTHTTLCLKTSLRLWWLLMNISNSASGEQSALAIVSEMKTEPVYCNTPGWRTQSSYCCEAVTRLVDQSLGDYITIVRVNDLNCI